MQYTLSWMLILKIVYFQVSPKAGSRSASPDISTSQHTATMTPTRSGLRSSQLAAAMETTIDPSTKSCAVKQVQNQKSKEVVESNIEESVQNMDTGEVDTNMMPERLTMPMADEPDTTSGMVTRSRGKTPPRTPTRSQARTRKSQGKTPPRTPTRSPVRTRKSQGKTPPRTPTRSTARTRTPAVESSNKSPSRTAATNTDRPVTSMMDKDVSPPPINGHVECSEWAYLECEEYLVNGNQNVNIITHYKTKLNCTTGTG